MARPSENRPRREGEEGERKSGRSDYKAKRSFSRNKQSREKQKDDKPRKSFGSRSSGPSRKFGSDRPFTRRDDSSRGEKSSEKPRFGNKKPFDRERSRSDEGQSEKPRFGRKKPFERERGERSEENSDKPRFGRNKTGGFRDRDKEKEGSDKSRFGRSKTGGFRERDAEKDFDKPRFKKRSEGSDSGSSDRPRGKSRRFNDDERPVYNQKDRNVDRDDKPVYEKSWKRSEKPSRRDEEPRRRERGGWDDKPSGDRKFSRDNKKSGGREERPAPKKGKDDGLIRLNKYLSNAGIASRREADTLIQSGAVTVNGVVVDQLGYKIKPGDKVTYGGESVQGERKVYLLLNKPKDYITTVDDPQERKTVMELISGACRERVYPVGRLDRNTTGVLLFTNDGELTTKLTHPKFGVKKLYHVSIDKNLKPADFKSIVDGIELEDGVIQADDLAFTGEGKKEIGIEIHSGRNRIVRRIFEHLGYSVLKLDRVMFAGLTKKDLPRGKHRFLTPREVSFLKMIG